MTNQSHETLVDGSGRTHLEQKVEVAQHTADALQRQYDELLTDPDVIQEDRDAVGALLASARGALERAQEGLRRVADGTYGRCSSCGKPISPERLAAVPDAERCIDCST